MGEQATVPPQAPPPAPLLVVSTETIPGFRIVRATGLVQGSTVRAKNGFRDFAANIKNALGGELKGYTELMNESRAEAIGRMLGQAQATGANAVVCVRFSTSSIAERAAEVVAYGTAVVVEPEA